MSDPAIIEAALQAMSDIEDALDLRCGDDSDVRKVVYAIVATVTPLIRAAALEEAAVVAEKHTNWPATIPETWAREEIAAAIRALKVS